MKRLFFCVLLAALISGCASLVRSNYAGDKTYTSLKDAVKNEAIVGMAVFDKTKNLRISYDSPNIEFSGTSGRFEIVGVKGEKDQLFTLTAVSLCDCFGFRKTFTVLSVYLLDNSGNVIAKGNPKSGTNFVQGKFPAAGDYYFFVIADATTEGKTVGSIQFIPHLPITVPMTAEPTGLIQVTWQKKPIGNPPIFSSGQK